MRVGLALSDDSGVLATPLETVENSRAITRIREIVEEKKIQKVVIGMPRNMDGSYGAKAVEVQQFVKVLQKHVHIQIQFWDERLTTLGINRMLIEADISRKRRKEIVDKLAAQQILQNYLDAQVE